MRCLKGLVLVAGFLCPALLGFGQSQLGTGSIVGTVTDPQGSSVPDATVVAVNQDTGITRQATTGPTGVYTIAVLPVGTYTIRIQKEGFATQERKGVVVSVGASPTIDATLQLGSVRQVLTVEEAAAPIESSKTETSSLVNRTQIVVLPLNGRRYDQFALLAPGVTRDGAFGLLSYHGQSGVFNNFMIEGNDDNQHFFSEAAGRTRIAMSISQDALQEFQVASSNFLAEVGGAAGGAINTVIRSGANAVHGDGFYYYRDQNLSARDPFATIRPSERRQQYGGSVGGPLKRDKAFFFLNYEQQKRNAPIVISQRSDLTDPSTCAKAKISGVTAAQEASACAAAISDLTTRFPTLSTGFTVSRQFNQWLFLTKEDIQLNEKNLLSASFNNLHWHAPNGIQTGAVLTTVGNNGDDDVRHPTVNVRLTSTLSPRTVNEFRWQWFRDWEFENSADPTPHVQIRGAPIGNFDYGLATFLQRPAFPDERHLEFVDNITMILGTHSLKLGGLVNRVTDKDNNPTIFGGFYTYPSEAAYGLDLLPGTTGQHYNPFQQDFGIPGISFRTMYYALFAQDQWKPTRRVTVNYGVRWDYQRFPSVVAPNPNFGQTQVLHSDRKEFGPRAGIAFDLTGSGKTILRGGYGIFYANTAGGLIFDALTQTGLPDPTKNTLALTFVPGSSPGAPVFPNTLSSLPPNATALGTLFLMDSNWRNPRVQEVNAGVEQALTPTITLSATYVFTRGDRLPLSFDINLPAPNFTRSYQLPDGSTFTVPFSAGVTKTAAGASQNINASRPNPNFGALVEQRPFNISWYHALLIEARRRAFHGVQFQISYTLSKNTDLAGTGTGIGGGPESPFGGASVLNQFNFTADKGRSPLDQHHRLIGNMVWEMPFGKSGSGFGSALVRNYVLSTIYTIQSGRPYSTNITVPSIPFSTTDGTQWNGFGGLLGQSGLNVLPTVPRNNNTGYMTDWLDLRFGRRFHLSERVVVSVMGEGFNLFNTANANSFRNTAFNATATSATTPLVSPVTLTALSSFAQAAADPLPPDGTSARRFQIVARVEF